MVNSFFETEKILEGRVEWTNELVLALLDFDGSWTPSGNWAMLVGDSLVSGEFLDADNSDLDLLEDEH